MRRSTAVRLAVTAVVAVVLAAVALPAQAGAGAVAARVRQVDPVRDFARQLRGIERNTDVPVLWPDRLAIDVPRRHGIEATWVAGRKGWELTVAIGPRCGGANACHVGELSAVRGARLAFRREVRLAGGVVGRFKPSTCGASCSPPTLQWRSDRVLYTIQFRAAGRGSDLSKLVALANSAIEAGPR